MFIHSPSVEVERDSAEHFVCFDSENSICCADFVRLSVISYKYFFFYLVSSIKGHFSRPTSINFAQIIKVHRRKTIENLR